MVGFSFVNWGDFRLACLSAKECPLRLNYVTNHIRTIQKLEEPEYSVSITGSNSIQTWQIISTADLNGELKHISIKHVIVFLNL